MSARREQPLPPDLEPAALLTAYASGAFPMPTPDDESDILWYSPDPRALLPLDGRFHVPRRLRQVIRQGRFECTVDRAFPAVMRGCGRREEGTWITAGFLAAYGRLHELGFAHSVEAWPAGGDMGVSPMADDAAMDGKSNALAAGETPVSRTPVSRPVGGVYGVALGGAFFAESMYPRDTDAGKVALVALVEHLRGRGFVLCDVQWLTPHLETFGACELSRAEYLSLLATALGSGASF